MALQHLRSSTANKRPLPAGMSDGQLGINTNDGSPGIFFKDSNGALVKVGPVHVSATAPNASPASGGATGNSKGEQWLDTSGTNPVLKVWDGSAWQSEAGEFVNAAGDVMTGALGIIAGTAGSPGLYVSGDTNTGVFSPGADQLAIATGGTGRLFVDDGGRIMAGVSTALTNAYAIGTALTPAVQIQGNTGNAAALSITRNTSAAANLLLQRGVSGTPVIDADAVGQINFNGYDGTNYFNAALIRGIVDGTPGTGSMPGRLSLQTTPTGSTTPVERLRIDSAGQLQAASLGTAAAPVISFVADVNTGLYSPGADQVSVTTGGSERIRIGASGQIGLGGANYGTSGQVLTSNGSGAAPSWQAAAAGSGTSITQGNTTAEVIDTGSDGRFVVTTEGSERVRVDSSGRLLVGTSTVTTTANTSTNNLIAVESTNNYSGGSFTANINDSNGSYLVLKKSRGTSPGSATVVQNGDEMGGIYFEGTDGSVSRGAASIRAFVDATPGANDMPGRIVLSTTAAGASSPTERMRINASGQTLIGKTSDTLSTPGWAIDGGSTIGRGQLTCGSTGAPILRLNHTGGAGTEYAVETWKNGTQVGSISVTASATAYTTSSDYRLKENVIPVTDGIARLQQLKPSRFNFIADADKTVDGFIAHEVQTIVPEAITGEKDAVDDDGNPVYQGIDQSKLVPLLTAALQEAVAKIESLEARLTAAGI